MPIYSGRAVGGSPYAIIHCLTSNTGVKLGEKRVPVPWGEGDAGFWTHSLRPVALAKNRGQVWARWFQGK